MCWYFCCVVFVIIRMPIPILQNSSHYWKLFPKKLDYNLIEVWCLYFSFVRTKTKYKFLCLLVIVHNIRNIGLASFYWESISLTTCYLWRIRFHFENSSNISTFKLHAKQMARLSHYKEESPSNTIGGTSRGHLFYK